MFRIIVTLILLSPLCFSSSPLKAQELNKDIILNYFKTVLPWGDHITVYFQDDSRFLIFPSFDNREHVHICSGSWRFSKSSETLSLRGGENCRFMKGTYQIVHGKGLFKLVEESKKIVLEHMEDN